MTLREDGPITAYDMIAKIVRRSPDAVAIECGDRRTTYRSLDARVARLARELKRRGVRHEERVAVVAERSDVTLMALLAIIRAGGAYVPVASGTPASRISAVLGDAKPLLTLVDDRARHAVSAVAPACAAVDLGSLWTESASGPDPAHEEVEMYPHNLAYVLYTSGSTGAPKGVQIEHHSLTNFLRSMHTRPGLDTSDRLLAATTLTFDIAGLELFLPLTAGATVVVATAQETADATTVAATLSARRITTFQATPSALKGLIDSGWRGNRDLKVLCGGEALSVTLARELLARVGALWNMYGPTETTIWSSCGRVLDCHQVTLGQAIDHTTLQVIDCELVIGGAGVARGYINRPDLTAAAFIPDSAATEPGARAYRTGDRVTQTADGQLEFAGRTDGQLKLRGHRIETGELEVLLSERLLRTDAVVMAHADVNGEPRLVAYYVPPAPQGPSSAVLRRRARELLPVALIPHAFVPLRTFPRTQNGKLDRKRLPNPFVRSEDAPTS